MEHRGAIDDNIYLFPGHMIPKFNQIVSTNLNPHSYKDKILEAFGDINFMHNQDDYPLKLSMFGFNRIIKY